MREFVTDVGRDAHTHNPTPRPRESAFDIVHLINSRNQNVALLALAVRGELK